MWEGVRVAEICRTWNDLFDGISALDNPMARYWWVNHKQTAQEEIEGQYLWSPKSSKGGIRNEFYLNMRRASPGDIVISYANGRISYIGRIAEFAFTAPKPKEFGAAGAYWAEEGWLLPVFWVTVPSIRPKDYLPEIRPLLPDRYSPLQRDSGNGLQGAYLAEIPEPLFAAVLRHTSLDWPALLIGGSNSLNFEVVNERLDDLVEQQIDRDASLAETTRRSVIEARRGQGVFRKNVHALEAACRLTGITNPALLLASHIKPWRVCASSEERLDGSNGLMLSPDADHLFDRGFISFQDDGEVLVSPRVDRNDLRRLGFGQLADELGLFEAPVRQQDNGFNGRHSKYLAYHRSDVFIK